MKIILVKIYSIILLVTFSLSSLGFVVSTRNCDSCKSCCEKTEDSAPQQNCCQVELEQSSCCAKTQSVVLKNKSNCNCDKIKCAEIEFVKYDYKLLPGKLLEISFKLKNFYIVTINNIKSDHSFNFLNILKYDPPPIKFKDINFIFEQSRLKIPSSILV